MVSLVDLITRKGTTPLQDEIVHVHLNSQTIGNIALNNPTILGSTATIAAIRRASQIQK